uniref:hypothetical protein n=1 Tax=Brevundimonas sp. TWP3-1-2b1 TaxID=2804650 RepID=UPI003CEB5609
MNTAMIRKALLPVLAASAVLASTPALAQSLTHNDSDGYQALASLRVSRRIWATKTQAVAEAMVASKS